MKTFDFTEQQVLIMREALNSYSEQCAFSYDDERSEKMKQMYQLYQMLSPHRPQVHTLCDY